MSSILCSNGAGTQSMPMISPNTFLVDWLEYIKDLPMNVSSCDIRYHNTVFKKIQKHIITFENCVSGAEMVFKRLYLGSTLFWKNAKYFTRNTLIAPHTGSGSTFVEGLGGVSPAVGEDPNTIFRHSFIVSRAFFQAFSSWVNHSTKPALLYTLNSFPSKV